MDEKDQACLDSFRLMTTIPHACGHVTELHHNNLALEDKHFGVLVPLPCFWCAAEAEGVPAEAIENSLEHHGHMRFWGQMTAFRRADQTSAEWYTIRDMELSLSGNTEEA